MKWDIRWTLGKLLGYLLFIIGTIFAFYFHDSTVLISMSGLGAGLLGLHNYMDTQNNKILKSNIYKVNGSEEEYKPTPKSKEEIG